MKKIITLAFAILFASCAKPLLTNTHDKRYKDSTLTTSPIISKIGILPLAKVAEPAVLEPKTFMDLKDNVQLKYLEVIAKNTKSNDEIIKFIKQPLTVEKAIEEKKPQTDFSKITLRLSFTHVKNYFNVKYLNHPSTRLEFLNTTLSINKTLPIPNPKTNLNHNSFFYSIDKIENEFDLIDLGTLGRTKNVTFGVEVSPEFGSSTLVTNKTTDAKDTSSSTDQTANEGANTNSNTDKQSKTSSNEAVSNNSAKVSGKLKYDNVENIEEQVKLNLKRLKTGFSFNNNSLTISQRGVALNDIVDGTVVTATFMLKNIPGDPNVLHTNVVTNFKNLWDNSQKPNSAAKINFNTRAVTYYKCSSGKENIISLDASCEGSIRIVNNTDKTNMLEYDDKVTFANFKETISPITIDLNDYCKRVFNIKIKDKPKNIEYVLHLIPRNGSDTELLFFQDDNYNEFMSWLNKVVNLNDVSLLKSELFSMYFSCQQVPCTNIKVIDENMATSDLTLLKNLLKNNYMSAVEFQ